MMKVKTVFILKHRYHIGEFGVFTTEAKAQAFADKINRIKKYNISCDKWFIVETPLDRTSL